VVVVSRDRPALLRDCLASLARQERAERPMEVVVIDDGSREPLATSSIVPPGLTVRVIRQEPLGLSAARNRGIAETRGEIVAFVDDDALASPGWAAAVERAFEEHRCDAMGGRIVLGLEREIPRWLTEGRLSYLSRFDLGEHDLVLSQPPFGFGANFAVTRSALAQAGGFRLELGRASGSLLSNEEVDLLGRVARLPGRMVYGAQATVTHRVANERLTKGWFRRRARGQGASDARLAGRWAPPAIMLGREVLRGGRAVPILARRLLERRGPFDAELWLQYCWGRAKQILEDRTDTRRPCVFS
jgi:glucosyl-dolichyl phosphate glucuronosyltransferase